MYIARNVAIALCETRPNFANCHILVDSWGAHRSWTQLYDKWFRCFSEGAEDGKFLGSIIWKLKFIEFSNSFRTKIWISFACIESKISNFRTLEEILFWTENSSGRLVNLFESLDLPDIDGNFWSLWNVSLETFESSVVFSALRNGITMPFNWIR